MFGFALVSPVYAQTPENDQVIIEHDWQIAEYFLADTDGDGVFEGKINLPEVAGEYVIRTIFYYEDGTVEDIENKVLIDPKGYLYEHIDGKELRIPNATISIYWLNQKTNKYELWPAQDFDQKNPQITDKTGEYSFFVPEGKYYLTTEALDYRNFQSEKFEAKEGEVINKNIELTPVRKFDWRWLMASFVFIMGLLIGTFVKYWYLPTKKKILIWLAIVGLILVFGVLAIRFAPGLFSSRETKLENKETPASVPQEKSIGSQLIPKTQENVEVIFGTGEDEKTTEAAKTQNPELRITNTPTGWLNVRDAASLDGKTIGKVYPGDEYEYTNEKNGWYEIILKDKTEGWIFGSYAEKIKN